MSRHWSRRETLRAGICLLGSPLAGCTTESDSGTPAESTPTTRTATASTTRRESPSSTRTETRTPTSSTESSTSPEQPVSLVPGESYETADGWSVTVENLAVRVSVVEFGTVHHDPAYADDALFVVADAVISGGGGPDPAELALFVRTDTIDRSDRIYVAAESNQDDTRQRFAVPVPVSPAPSDGALVWTPDEGRSIRWELPAETVAAIANPPEFRLREFEARYTPDEEVEITITVENVGTGDGTFLAEVGDEGLSDQPEISVDVPAGETVTATRRIWADFAGREELPIVLRWRDRNLRRTVQRS